MMYVELMRNFYLADSNKLMAVRFISGSWAQKKFHCYFLEMMYVKLMKNFHNADSNEPLSVRLISASSTQKHFIPIF